MPTLPVIANERFVTSNMKQIMGTMKGIAMSSFVEVKKKREKRFDTFTQSFESFFHLADHSKAKSQFVQPDSATICVVAVTSNESFMAGLNNKVIKLAREKVENRPCHFVITGPRMIGRLKMEKVPYTIFPGFRDKNMHDVATQIKDFVTQKVRDKEFGKVIAVYADPVSLSTQEIRAVTLLPAHDVYAKNENLKIDRDELFCQETNLESIMEYLSEIWIIYKLISLFQDNKLSEYAAQAMQLDGSLQNLEDLEKRLKLQFVKTRRELIDASLRETVTAMMVNTPA
ncbi:MAG: F0F1 ATP synthase subunit gamma [Candidatus Omnitrophica bacterium]|jgi:ATP synthase F1 gamma subunit|nr:F0F1 ATP synthase subunit gamma [Candidatus Omnitrophota bacterium]